MKKVTSDGARAGKTLHALAIAVGVLLLSVSLFGQGSFGRILGTVTDQTGAVLSGAMVSVIDQDRGITRTLTTDAAGEYNAPTLIPGKYTVRVDAAGFKRLERPNVVLQIGQELRVDLTPQPGDQTQTVTVTEAIPLVDAASATLGGALTNAEVNDLPLNGRNYQSLLGLRPGVVLQRGGSPWTQSTNNSRPDETAWMVDGVLNSTFWDATPVVGAGSYITDGAAILPIDAIQEFNLMENPKAEYGWKPGAIVNVGIRSGTNTYHGSAYAFGRDVSWDARNIFNPVGTPLLPTQLEQFGGVIGGPIKKDKLFFFGGFEGLRSSVGTVYAVQIPETGPQPIPDPQHSTVDAISALQAHGITPSPVSLKLLGCTTAPLTCTGGLLAGATPNSTSYTSTFPNTNVSNNGVGKLDYNINDKHRLNWMWWQNHYEGNGQDFPNVNQLFTDSFPKVAKTTDANWVWTPSSTVVNEARFGYNNNTQFAGGIDPGIPNGQGGLCTATGCGGKFYPLNTGLTNAPPGLPVINMGGFLGNTGDFLGARGGRPILFGPSPFYDYNDSISVLRGKHALKFGGEFAHIGSGETASDIRGRIQFKGGTTPGLTDCGGQSCPLEDFFAGNPTRATQLVGNGLLAVTELHTAVFFQDDWRIVPKLMINLGLRWEHTSPFKADNNLLGNFDPATGLVQQGQQGVGSTIWKPDYKDFSPRVGFAWDVTGKGTTVIRGGGGILYSTPPLATFTSQPGEQNVPGGSGLNGVPTGACATKVPIGTPCPMTVDPGAPGKGISLGTASIPGSALNWNGVLYPGGAGLSCTPAVPCSVAAINPNLKTPYVASWTVGIQHAFGNDLSLDVGYVGNHGDNFLGIRDLNMINPATGVAPFATQYPYLQYINYTSNYARSNYESLQTTLTKRLSHGLNFTAGYTYGHGLDNGSLNRFGLLPQNSLNTNAEYGDSDLDVRHRFTLTASYAIPGKNGFGQILQGWKLNGIVNIQSAQPWDTNDTTFNFSGNGDSSDRWDFFGNPSDFKSIGTHSIPFCTGPGSGGCSITDSFLGQEFFSAAQSTSMWAQCTAVAPDARTLSTAGCYVSGKSVMTPPTLGTFGTMGRNIFRDTGFSNVDFSIFKDFKFKERIGAEFRFEVFNLFNHPVFANPYGSAPGSAQGGFDPSGPPVFGCGCTTPDIQAGNPIVGSGGARDIQLGFKLTF
ncbi:MAG TPA: carboxypeptidase regulatory-like domain-containing protein [Bryobacteraceae bacterium]|nr:carboxypeptidase regulatory-like domain-containing protein [Bryobacteraceae bacterium]